MKFIKIEISHAQIRYFVALYIRNDVMENVLVYQRHCEARSNLHSYEEGEEST
jgi:hypothetical protein